MKDTSKVTRIEVIDEKGRSYVNNNANNKVEFHLQDNDRTLKVIVKQQVNATEEAEKLGFKVGDLVWKNSKLVGKIGGFGYLGNDLCAFGAYSGKVKLSELTNKVAIHCPTKEELKFIYKLLNYNKFKDEFPYYDCVMIDRDSLFVKDKYISKDEYLILTIDEYFESIGQKPILITEDGVKTYKGMKVWYYDKSTIKVSWCYNDNILGYSPARLYFSTEQAANEYLESLKPKFEVNKWYKYKDYSDSFALYTDCTYKNGFIDGKWIEKYYEMNCYENWVEANMDKVKQLLLNECKRRFPIGSKVYPIYNDNSKTLSEILGSYYWAYGSDAPSCYAHQNDIGYVPICLFYKGKWAEVISQAKVIKWLVDSFQVLKLEDYKGELSTDPKGKIFDNEKDALLYHNQLKEFNKYAMDRDYFINKYCRIKGSDLDIDKKNTIEVEIPEGYKVKYVSSDAGGHIDAEAKLESDKCTIIGFEKQSTKSCSTCLFEKHFSNKNTICKMQPGINKTCTNWQSKQDLSNTKLFVGDNPRLSKLIQEKAFELGWRWNNDTPEELQVMCSHCLYFYKDKDITHGDNKEYFNNHEHVEISAQDLGIKEEDYKVLFVTTDGINIYRGDRYWYIYGKNSIETVLAYELYYLDNTVKFRFSTKELAEQYVESLKPKTIVDKPCLTCKYRGFGYNEEPCVDCITQTTEFKNYTAKRS